MILVLSSEMTDNTNKAMSSVKTIQQYNDSSFGDFVDRIYPVELEIKNTPDTDRSASCLDLHLESDTEGRLRTKTYDKRDDFNFPFVNFPFICSNIPAPPAYGVYISQLIRYSRACGSYQDFKGSYWTQDSSWLSWSHHVKSFTIATTTWLTVLDYLCQKWPRVCSTCRKHFPGLSSFMTYDRVCN